VTQYINTDRVSVELRRRGVDARNRRILVTYYPGSAQAQDLSEPPNCDGTGRIRHFHRGSDERWSNPLPMDPACHALKLNATDALRAQVFQNAICNWRCWYCYVDFDLLSANPKHARWMTADELITLYQRDARDAPVIDLSGGQPDLTPEWVPWTMESLKSAGLADSVYLWSDDNLSNDFLWKFLSSSQLDALAEYPMYGKVACFKGIDSESFSFNTLADPRLFDRQFELFERLLDLRLDLYAYVTFTTASDRDLKHKVAAFADRLQRIDELLPLRTVPLRVAVFTPTTGRLSPAHSAALLHQETVLDLWREELAARFDKSIRARPITDIQIGHR
jgi:organic radical activating enzyme